MPCGAACWCTLIGNGCGLSGGLDLSKPPEVCTLKHVTRVLDNVPKAVILLSMD